MAKKRRRRLKPVVKQTIVAVCCVYAGITFAWSKFEEKMFYPTTEQFLESAVAVEAEVLGWQDSPINEGGKVYLTLNYGKVYKEIEVDEYVYRSLEGQETVSALYSPKYTLMVLDAESLDQGEF